jgi:hypothetical protein
MPTITVKNISPDIYARLKNAAKTYRRSINSEILFRLENSLRSVRIDADTFLARIDALQQQTPLPPLTDEMLQKAKEQGRP